MDRIEHLRRRFAYEHWANRAVLEGLIAQDAEGTKATGLIAHILMSQGAWLERMDGNSTEGWDFFPELTIEECRILLDANREKFNTLLAEHTEESLEESRRYRNSMGEEFSSTIDTVLTHLLVHGAYHRGQIAAKMREAGMEPARTDFIFYDRSSA